LIGIISEKLSLSAGLSLLILLMIVAAIVAWRNQFLESKKLLTAEMPYDEQIY